jgi:hypothetical protein
VASDDDVASVDEAVERGGGVAVGRLAELDAFQDVLAVGVGGERVFVLFGRLDEGEEDDEAVRGVSGRGWCDGGGVCVVCVCVCVCVCVVCVGGSKGGVRWVGEAS